MSPPLSARPKWSHKRAGLSSGGIFILRPDGIVSSVYTNFCQERVLVGQKKKKKKWVANFQRSINIMGLYWVSEGEKTG